MLKRIIFIGLALCSTTFLVSCSSDEDTVAVSTYQGAGSKWAAAFSGSTFTLSHFDAVTDTTPDMTVTGTFVDYSTGFRRLVVTSATGIGAPAAGAEAYGFEVPGFAFFLKPVEVNSEPIVMINAGSCPADGFDANWIIASFDATVTLDNTKDSFGHATFVMNGASSSASIYQLNAEDAGVLNGGTPQVAPFDYGTCSGGVLTFSPTPGETVDMFFTSSGGALVHSYDGASHDNIIFAAPKHTGAVTQAELAGTYSALVFDDNNPSDKLFPAKLVIPASGAASVNKIADVEDDTLTADPAIPIDTFTAVGASPGLFTAVIDGGGANGRMSCTYIPVGATKVIACNGYGQDAQRGEPFFFLGKSR